jgi:hypothetical protein
MFDKLRKWAWLIISILLFANAVLNYSKGQLAIAGISLVLSLGSAVFTYFQFKRAKRSNK